MKNLVTMGTAAASVRILVYLAKTTASAVTKSR